MQLGMIGLGRMGANMVRRLIAGGQQCVACDVNPVSVQESVKQGAVGASTLEELVRKAFGTACHLADGAGGRWSIRRWLSWFLCWRPATS